MMEDIAIVGIFMFVGVLTLCIVLWREEHKDD